MRSLQLVVLLTASLAARALPLAAQEAPDTPPPAFGETLSVELATVPFYAVDQQGQPVWDLRPDEVELWVDGRSVPFESFDRYGASEALKVPAETGDHPGAERLLPPSQPRHVFLLFDQVFSTSRGLAASREVADRVLAQLPATDWVYVLSFTFKDGLKQRLGPLPATAENRTMAKEDIATLAPDIGHVTRHASLDPIANADCKKCIADDGVASAYADIQSTEQVNYQAIGRAQAAALDSFATFLRQLKGPKLVLFFSQGMDTKIYTEGVDGENVGERLYQGAANKRSAPAKLTYEGPLKALGQSGASVMFVNGVANTQAFANDYTEWNSDADAALVNSISSGESTLALMAQVSGGKVLQHTNFETLSARIEQWSSAYYEVGFYLEPGAKLAANPRVELKISRPGVDAWTPKWVKTRKEYRELSDREKRFVIADLVLHGPEGQAIREIDNLLLQRLDGDFADQTTGSERTLALEAKWPEPTQLRSLEVYSIVFQTATADSPGKVVSLRRGAFTPTTPSSRLDVRVPTEGQFLWGVVAVDVTDSVLYLRRMAAQPPAASTASGSAR